VIQPDAKLTKPISWDRLARGKNEELDTATRKEEALVEDLLL
jgi:hypothetical protein